MVGGRMWNRDGFKSQLVGFLFFWAFFASAATIYFMLSGPYNGGNDCPYKWNGGSPLFKGSCWCGWDGYCLCTPSLAIDAIIEVNGDDEPDENIKVVLVHRRDPPRDLFATPGGFVDVGETVEQATIREVKEETNLDLDHLEQFRVYSDPSRDKRRHTVSSVFKCKVKDASKLKKGDDAKSVVLVSIMDIPSLETAFDHKLILTDYLKHYHPTIAKKLLLTT